MLKAKSFRQDKLARQNKLRRLEKKEISDKIQETRSKAVAENKERAEQVPATISENYAR